MTFLTPPYWPVTLCYTIRKELRYLFNVVFYAIGALHLEFIHVSVILFSVVSLL